MRLYLAGPMTGIEDHNFPAFNAAACELRQAGYDVYDPADAVDDPALSWEHHMRRDIRALMDCDGIALLPYVEESRGARLEMHVGRELGLRLMYVPDWLRGAR